MSDVIVEQGKSYKTQQGFFITIRSQLPTLPHEPKLFRATNHCVYDINGIPCPESPFNGNKDLIDPIVKEIVTDEDRRQVKYPIDLYPGQPVSYAFEDLRLWGEIVFGPVKPSRIVERADEEMTELKEAIAGDVWTDKALEEAADIVVILTRAPGLWDAIMKKMAINANRQWNIKGDGTGYHVPQ